MTTYLDLYGVCPLSNAGEGMKGNTQIRWLRRIILIGAVCLAFLFSTGGTLSAFALTQENSVYQERAIHNPDGTGKFYMGREISQVMGHLGAGWLERPTREFEEQPQLLIEDLHLKPTDVVADIGAGTGYFSFRIAPLVPQGKVLAIDIQPEMIEILNEIKREKNISNVEPVLASETDPRLEPSSIDLAIMVDAYHEFEYPYEVMQKVVQALKPDGRVILVEYRGENPFIPIKGLHKMTQKQIKKEMANVGLSWIETKGYLPQQHVMVFGKSGDRPQKRNLVLFNSQSFE